MTHEQIVRSVLERAVEDGLVSPMEKLEDPDPQSRTDAEVQGCVIVLREGLKLMAGQSQAVPAPHRLPQRTRQP